MIKDVKTVLKRFIKLVLIIVNNVHTKKEFVPCVVLKFWIRKCISRVLREYCLVFGVYIQKLHLSITLLYKFDRIFLI